METIKTNDLAVADAKTLAREIAKILIEKNATNTGIIHILIIESLFGKFIIFLRKGRDFRKI